MIENYIRSALDDGRNLISHPFSLEKSISCNNWGLFITFNQQSLQKSNPFHFISITDEEKKKKKKKWNLPLGKLWRKRAKYCRLWRRSALSNGCWVGKAGGGGGGCCCCTAVVAGGDGLDAPGIDTSGWCSRRLLTATVCKGVGGILPVANNLEWADGSFASSDGGRDGGRSPRAGGCCCGGGVAAALELVVVKLTPSSSNSSSSSIDRADDFVSPPLRLSSSIPGNSSSPEKFRKWNQMNRRKQSGNVPQLFTWINPSTDNCLVCVWNITTVQSRWTVAVNTSNCFARIADMETNKKNPFKSERALWIIRHLRMNPHWECVYKWKRGTRAGVRKKTHNCLICGFVWLKNQKR